MVKHYCLGGFPCEAGTALADLEKLLLDLLRPRPNNQPWAERNYDGGWNSALRKILRDGFGWQPHDLAAAISKATYTTD